MAVLEISNDYGYVLLVAGFSALVGQWHGMQTVKARKASGIGYPNTFATAEQAEKDPAAFQLNCAQRAHANYSENYAPFITNLLIAGLRFPVPAAVTGAAWLVSRIVYTKGYVSNKGPKGRTTGAIGHYLSMIGLLGMTGYTGYKTIMGN